MRLNRHAPIRSTARQIGCVVAALSLLVLAGCRKPTALAAPPPPTVGVPIHGTSDLFGRFYLVPFDVNPGEEDCASCLSGDEFKQRLDNMPGEMGLDVQFVVKQAVERASELGKL